MFGMIEPKTGAMVILQPLFYSAFKVFGIRLKYTSFYGAAHGTLFRRFEGCIQQGDEQRCRAGTCAVVLERTVIACGGKEALQYGSTVYGSGGVSASSPKKYRMVGDVHHSCVDKDVFGVCTTVDQRTCLPSDHGTRLAGGYIHAYSDMSISIAESLPTASTADAVASEYPSRAVAGWPGTW